MKLTPEQKAFYEYGEARGILKERKSLMRFTEGYGECSDYHGEPRMMYGVEDAIRNAWQKRAACRAWIPPQQRRCFTCKHDVTHYKLCALCHGVGWPISWEPRKEASND